MRLFHSWPACSRVKIACSGCTPVCHPPIDPEESAQFINTAIVALVVNARIDAIKQGLPRDLEAAFPLFAGAFPDFTDTWYEIVGVQILTTVMINAVLPLLPLLMSVLLRCIAPLRARCASTQPQLNDLYTGAQFSLSPRYGMLQTCAFTCFLYSSGMPILVLVAAVTFLVTYAIDRVQLLRLSVLPPQYDEKLALSVLKAFKYCIVLHLMFGCWVFSAQRADGNLMFPRPELPGGSFMGRQYDSLLNRVFGCSQLSSESTCNASMSCLWSSSSSGDHQSDWLEKSALSDGAGSCHVDRSSAAFKSYSFFDIQKRQLNWITLPYFLVTVISMAVVILKQTPLWPPLMLLGKAISGLVVKILLLPCSSLSFMAKLVSNRVAPETPGGWRRVEVVRWCCSCSSRAYQEYEHVSYVAEQR